MRYFDHPYPRFGLAYTLFHHDIQENLEAALADEERLAHLAAEVIDDSLNYVRLYTEDRPSEEGETELRFRYVSRDNLKGERGNDQDSDHFFYCGPYVATDDTGTNRLIRKARDFRDKLQDGEKFYAKDREFKRSFSPFTAKINEGSPNLSDPKGTRLQVVFTLIATLARHKPAKLVWLSKGGKVRLSNQVIIPDLDVEDLIDFIDLFQQMQGREIGEALTRHLKPGKRNYRPPIFDGNYPDAPRSPAFGPVGLLGAMGKWIQRAEDVPWAEAVLKKIPDHPLYLVSYEQNLMRQAHIGHHVAKLALQHDLSKALAGLHRSSFYKSEDNERTETGGYTSNRKLFYMMAGRFLQFYTRPAFRDFLAFRVQYEASFLPILEDYFMSQRQIPEDLVRSARAYGAYLNLVAYLIAKDEIENKDTGRSLYEAKSRALAQMESTAMSAKSTSALFGRLNRDAGQQSNRDAPAEAGPFMEAAIAGRQIDRDTTKQLILAFMRLRTQNSGTPSEATTSSDSETEATAEDDPMMPRE